MSCESHPLPPYFEYESDDEASRGSPRDEVRSFSFACVLCTKFSDARRGR